MQKKNYRIGDPETDKMIETLAEVCVSDECRGFFREILTTAVKMGLEHQDVGDFKLINSTLKELRHAFRVYVPYRKIRKVAVFGSSRISESNPIYTLTQELCGQLVQQGFMVISGAGGGVMEAANRGAGKENSFGVNIKLPFEQGANPFIEGDPKLMMVKYFFTRKLIFIKESDATVLLPGGFGTLDEGAECLTLFQTGKSLPRPIVLLEPEHGNYWKHLLKFVDSVLIPDGFIAPDDRKLMQIARSAAEAVDLIQNFYRVYHSLRYVRALTVMRLNEKLPAALLQKLNRDFKDIVVQGEIEASGALEEELKKNEFLDLPRLVFHFNKKNFGRLNEMIRAINNSRT